MDLISGSADPHFQPVALEKAYRLLNHGPTVLVSAAHGGERNVMAAAWACGDTNLFLPLSLYA